MSATGRSPVRRELDYYPTPSWAIDPILAHLPRGGIALDVGCGDGAILGRMLAAGWQREGLLGVEVDAGRAEACTETNGVSVVIADFLHPRPWGAVSVVIGNPPFTHAEAFARRALDVVAPQRGTVALLLRLAFLETDKRVAINREHPADVFVLPLRPSFTGNGKCDSAAYGWFVWSPGRGGRWSILDVEKPGKARGGAQGTRRGTKGGGR